MSLRNPVTTKVGGAGVVGRRAASDAYLEGTSSVFAPSRSPGSVGYHPRLRPPVARISFRWTLTSII
jgi:hypothetical protein